MIGERLRTLAGRWFGRGSDNRRRWLLLLGLAGIALIALTELLPSSPAKKENTSAGETVTARAVEQALEQRITALLTAVDGVGDCRVMVTLENGVQWLYAADSTSSSADSADGSASRSDSDKTLFVQTDQGPVGLLITEIQPSVKGVAVVCAGGDDPAVCERVTRLVTTAFHISSRRVCVVKQK